MINMKLTAETQMGILGAVRDALAATENYPGVTGSITFKDSRDPQKPLVVLRITPYKVEFVKKVVPGL